MSNGKAKSYHIPRVSVIMTTYNGAAFISETIDAILGQTFTDYEFIIVDDGSIDNTADIIRRYNDTRLQFMPNEKNMGISVSRNRAMSMARGEFLATTDQDDISRPERLARQISYLDSHLDVAMLSTDVILQRGTKSWPDPSPSFTNPKLVHMGLFFSHHNITYSTLCARLAVLRKNNLEFLQEYHYAEDFEFYHRVAKIGDIVTLPEALVVSRIHDNNTSYLCSNDMNANGLRFMTKAYHDLLGREVDKKEMEIIWHLVVTKIPAESIDELTCAGRLIDAAAEAFVKGYVATTADATKVREFASFVWWSVVRTGSASLGPSALRLYRSFPAISRYTPPISEKNRTLALSMIPMWVRTLLRNAIGRR